MAFRMDRISGRVKGPPPILLFAVYERGETLAEVASRFNLSKSKTRLKILQAGFPLRTGKEAIKAAASQGRMTRKGPRKKISQSSHERMKLAAKARWAEKTVGVSRKPNGYLEITVGKSKGKMQHREVMEQAIGRPLTKDEVVHHIDHNRNNNDISNLQLMSRSEHTSFHRKERAKAQ